MSRALTLGNSSMVVGFDHFGRARDLYYPHVGLENHIGGHLVHHIGVWVDGTIQWFGNTAWDVSVNCESEALASKIIAKNSRVGVTLRFTDVVYNEASIFVRRVHVTNDWDTKREIKVFFGHQFEMYESHTAHTAYFDPALRALVHYKGRRFFLANGVIDNDQFQEYTTGVFGIEGKEGSHKDADDGMLQKNPIEHGPADSVMGFAARYAGGETKKIDYWLCVGKSYGEVKAHDEYVRSRRCGHLIQTTTDFWRAWVNRQNFTFYGLSDAVVDLFKKSLLLTRAHVDDTTGAIIASTDSSILQGGKDTYAYMWPRDGALTSIALYKSGSYTAARQFFTFCNDVITPAGYLRHKYAADKTLGSSWHPWMIDGKPILPIQEDETALVVYALWQYYNLSKNLEFIESIYNSFIKKAADFMLSFRDEKTGLPQQSYDLWEEKYGSHTFTAAAVSAAFEAVGRFAELLGKHQSGKQYQDAARDMRSAIMKHLYDDKSGVFYKSALFKEDDSISLDKTVDISSVHGIYTFGVLPVTDERVARAIKIAEERLTVRTNVSGIARYEGDNYHRRLQGTSGNPWCITTLWLAQYYIAIAESEEDMGKVKDWLEWCVRYAYPSGTLPEQLDPETGVHVSAGPLTWSHAEYVVTVIKYLDKLEQLGVCLACNPVG